MDLYRIFYIKVVYCPKKRDIVHLDDCKRCKHFAGIATVNGLNYVHCTFWKDKEIEKELIEC